LSITQYLAESGIDGAVIVTTPQEISLQDVRKQINFCRKVNLPVLGIIENMSMFTCPKCNVSSVIWPSSTGGADKMTEQTGVPLLGRLPLDPVVGQSCDQGSSLFQDFPESKVAQEYTKITKSLSSMINV